MALTGREMRPCWPRKVAVCSPLAEAILDRIKHDAYKINIIPTDPANYRSMREVYGLDPALSE